MSGKFWDDAWSLVEGCMPVSPACDNCWLARMSYKAQFQKNEKIRAANVGLTELRAGKPCFVGKVNFRADRLDIPLGKGKPKVYAIWSDLYHEGVTDEQIAKAFQAMTEWKHIFLIVTKRPERAARFHSRVAAWEGYITHDGMPPDAYGGTGIIMGASREAITGRYPIEYRATWPQDNIWHIVTAENQERADERIPHLLNIPGKRGLIIEPMLGPVDLSQAIDRCSYYCDYGDMWPEGHRPERPKINQVILGLENGPGKRPMEESWAHAVEEQCAAAGVPFYRKDQERGELAWRTK